MAKSTGVAIRSAFGEFVGRNPEIVPFKQIWQIFVERKSVFIIMLLSEFTPATSVL